MIDTDGDFAHSSSVSHAISPIESHISAHGQVGSCKCGVMPDANE